MAEVWPDENGDKVIITPFITTIYKDKSSMELNSKYNIYQPPKSIEALGKTQWETAANTLTEFYHVLRRTVGINSKELDQVGEEFSTSCRFGKSWDYSPLEDRGFFRTKKVMGIEVLFPTEELIKRAFNPRE